MKWKSTLSLVIVMGATVLVASVAAQQPSPFDHGRGHSPDVLDSRELGRLDGLFRDERGTTHDPLIAPPTHDANSPERKLAIAESDAKRRVGTLIQQLERAESDSRRDEIRSKLTESLGQQFDLRQKRHGLEIDALEARVKKLKQLVQKRQENRAEIISRRLDQIVRESQGLGF